MKLTILGGGGVRALMLAKSLSHQAKVLGIDELVFMDIDEEKLRVFGGMAREVGKRLNADVKITLTSNAEDAIRDADFVITTIRVGGDVPRTKDERIAIAHGLIGQETTGAGGFAMAMRSIPVLADYCEMVKKLAKPGAMVFNFTNPAGLVTQAMRNLGYDFVYGICDAPSGVLRQLVKHVGGTLDNCRMDVFGLNHLSYFGNFIKDGKDITKDLIADRTMYEQTDLRYFEPALVEHVGLLMNEYLYYFYYREKAERNLAVTEKTRGESIVEFNREMLKQLTHMDPEREFDAMLRIYSDFNHRREASYMATETSVVRNDEAVPLYDIYTPDEGGYAGIAMAFIKAKIEKKQSEMVLCVPNNGTVDWLEDEDIIETSCYIGPDGAFPKKMTLALPESAKNLIRTMKLYERNAVRAILAKDRDLAVDALMVHPLINSYSLAKALVDEYLAAHKDFVGDWN